MLFVGDWGASGSLRQQNAVAQSMVAYARRHRMKPGALFFLGDNFYGELDGGVASPRWRSQFEDAYPKQVFDCPCYAILGNHDYFVEPAGKHDAQLAYAARPGTRWTMPAKWYRFEFPRKNPLVTFIALDSNFTRGKLGLTRSERAAQKAWLEAQLVAPRRTPYLAICAHHPLYSNGDHGDSRKMIKLLDKHLRGSRAHLYMCGHDHDLQHLEFEGHPTSFVISGGGGAHLRDLRHSSKKRGPFASSVAGFTHLEITRRQMVVRHIGLRGETLHAFSKTPHGEVRLFQA
jgi:tartrate-resistant acid phosphatase type 5